MSTGLLSRLGAYVSGRARDYGRRLAFSVMGITTVAITGHFYISYQAKKLQDSVYNKITIGSRPKLLYGKVTIPRKGDEMVNWFVERDVNNCDDRAKKWFGVIVGPTGTGKSAIVRNICNRFPDGLLYVEVSEPRKFTKHLASELNLKIAPSGIFDVILGYYSSTYRMYYSLEENQADAFDTIMGVLKKQAIRYRLATGRVPTLFIDGADLLAKHDRDLFVRILLQAKVLANDGDLTIVFVSSEGAVVPLIQEASGASRCNKFFQVNDVDDNEAIKYLVKKGFPEKLSKMFVDYAGGRCVYLVNGEDHRYCSTKTDPDIQDHEWYERVIEDLFVWKLKKQRATLRLNEPHSSMILSVLSKYGEVDIDTMIQDEESKGIVDAIAKLVDANILRYTNINTLQWHGRPQERFFKSYHLEAKRS